MSLYDAVMAIPRSGRTFENFISKLSSQTQDLPNAEALIKAVKAGKKRKDQNYAVASQYLTELQSSPVASNLGLFIDRKREERPYRVGFLGADVEIGGLNVRIEGDEPHNCSSLVGLGEADIAVAGLDELLAVTHNSLSMSATKWGMYNYNLKKEHKVRIAGSAMLTRYNDVVSREVQDMVGFFLIAKQRPSSGPNTGYPKDYLEHLETHKNKVFVKGRYVEKVRKSYPKLNIEPVHDVEDAVNDSETGDVGLEIVQTGSTLRRKNLVLLGAPLFLSESLYVVDYYKYNSGTEDSLKALLDTFAPVGYFEQQRLEQFAYWYHALQENLGDSWINKPRIEDIFCSHQDSVRGLRPYSLKTRYWTPSDSYKRDDAFQFVENSISELKDIYNQVVSGQLK
ncbi:hypothetical protein [Catenovulum maritimum]|uniref:Uncharacterized protein n=1 Tax=Catenovulum maritimum TaxID=1513271 RepID=A0A0J8H0N1_9ALTE|nr:hypothetical protein [Catenovulum maritimum]KMT66573.1 hypothetical protein XM47_03310 [Catenovulum maritimum]